MSEKLSRWAAVLLMAIPCMIRASEEPRPIEIESVGEGVYQYVSWFETESWGWVPSSGLIVTHVTDAFIVDLPWNTDETRKLLSRIEGMGLTVTGSLSTHFHEDRTGGVALLNELGIPTSTTAKTRALMETSGMELPTLQLDSPVDRVFHDQVEIYYPGAGHSADNIVVWVPSSKVLVGGCMIRSSGSSSLGNVADASITDWASSTENVLERYGSASIVIPGHGSAGGIELLTHTISLATAGAAALENHSDEAGN